MCLLSTVPTGKNGLLDSALIEASFQSDSDTAMRKARNLIQDLVSTVQYHFSKYYLK